METVYLNVIAVTIKVKNHRFAIEYFAENYVNLDF